jgi:hypothetical protein
MRLLLFFVAFAIILTSCQEESPNENLVINGRVEGLKVGNVLLQKSQDTSLITLDSISLDGQSDFTLRATIEEPQLLFLYLDVKDGSKYDDRIAFFAEDTIMSIHTTLRNFEDDAVITGSKNQEALAVFNENKKKLNQVYTELMKRSMLLNQEEDPSQEDIDALNTDYEKYLNKKVLYALNYASFHKDKEVAPFILLQDAFDANPVLLDSIYNLMPKKIQTSLYGKELSEWIENREDL